MSSSNGVPGPAQADNPQPLPADIVQELRNIEFLHHLAEVCASALAALDLLRHFADGDRHARPALVALGGAVAVLPALPLRDDPFRGGSLVKLAGERASSAHAAVFKVARRTWRAAHVTDLKAVGVTEGRDEGGSFERITSAAEHIAPTEVEWTPDVWCGIREQIEQHPPIDHDTVAEALSFELSRAKGRLGRLAGPPLAALGPPAEVPPPEGQASGLPLAATCQDVAERMERLRSQGEPWTSRRKMAERLGCSTTTAHDATKTTPELLAWAVQPEGDPRAQSLGEVVLGRTPQGRVATPEEDARVREFLARPDLHPEERAFVEGLPLIKDQLFAIDKLDNPDDRQKILGRKP